MVASRTFRFAAQRRLLACTKPHEAAKSATSYIAMVDDTPGTSGPECNDVVLPKATVNKFSNEIAHSLGVRLTADTRELIANCCSEFVQLLSSEANEICEKDNKKTISPDHILRALESLGLDAYVPDVKGEYEKYRKEDRVRGKGKATRDKKMEDVDLEEMARQQEILFAMARGDPMAAMGSAPATPVAKAKVDNDVARAPATPAANQEDGGAEKSPQ